MSYLPGVWIDLPSGWTISLDAAVDLDPLTAAIAVRLSADEYLEALERWAAGAGFTYGLRVDRDAGTVAQAGRA